MVFAGISQTFLRTTVESNRKKQQHMNQPDMNQIHGANHCHIEHRLHLKL